MYTISGLVRTAQRLRSAYVLTPMATGCNVPGMESDPNPIPVQGKDLAELRRKCGIKQIELAARMGMHRVTLSVLERGAMNPVQAADYRRALRELFAEKTA
jgi:DNA-binding XRE family transcriptional regulator